MEIILLQRVENLGQMGERVTVKPGYARNFLLPKGKAIRATAENLKKFDAQRAQLEAENLAKKAEAQKIAEKMDGLSVQLIRAASEMGQLYGSASSRDIAEATTQSGFTINKNQVGLNNAIKTLGLFPVQVVLHPEVSVEVIVNIARSADEAAEQKRLGRAIISDVAERERSDAAAAAIQAEKRIAQQEKQEQNGGNQEDGEAETSEAPKKEAKAKKAKAPEAKKEAEAPEAKKEAKPETEAAEAEPASDQAKE